jgi:hypothetical protein
VTSRVRNTITLGLDKIPSYVFASHLEESYRLLLALYQRRSDIIYDMIESSATTYRGKNITAKFEQLTAEIEEDCMFVSSPTQISQHAVYQKLIALGKKAVPLLIKKLDVNPIFWFGALPNSCRSKSRQQKK